MFFSSISKVMANLKHIFQSAQILVIYIENSINMCFEMSVFANCRRDDFVNSSINLVIDFLLAIIVDVDDDVLWSSDWSLSWLFKIIYIIFWSVDNVFILSKSDVLRWIDCSNFCCRRCDNEFKDCLLNAFENRSFNLTTTNSISFI